MNFLDVSSIAMQPYMKVRHPDITVRLSDQDGNVYSLIGVVAQAMTTAGVDVMEVAIFKMDCMSKLSYNEVLTHIMQTVNVT